MSTLVLKINGTDRSSLVEWGSVQKTETLTKAPATLNFRIKNYPSKTTRPALNDVVTLFNGATQIYGGYVVKTHEEIAGALKYFGVSCSDYTMDLDRELVTESYTGFTVNAIIADIASKYLTGFTTANVNCPTVIDMVQFNYVTVSQCLKTLLTFLGNYDWYVDYAKDIHFFQNTVIASPFQLDDTSGNFQWPSLIYESDSSQVRNTIIIEGGLIPLSTTRNYQFSGDGTKTSFVLGDTLSGTPTLTVGGVGKTVGIDGVDADASFQWMWSAANNSVRSTAGNTAGAGTNNVVVTGYPLYPLVAIFENNASVVTFGVHQFLIQDKTILSQTAADQRAQAEILKYANPTYNGSFITNKDGLAVGQTLTIASTIRSISSSFKITQMVTTVYEPLATLQYAATFVSADAIGINDVLNRLLILDPSAGSGIPTNSVIEVIKQISEGMSVSDAISFLADSTGLYKWNAFTWGFGTWNA